MQSLWIWIASCIRLVLPTTAAKIVFMICILSAIILSSVILGSAKAAKAPPAAGTALGPPATTLLNDGTSEAPGKLEDINPSPPIACGDGCRGQDGEVSQSGHSEQLLLAKWHACKLAALHQQCAGTDPSSHPSNAPPKV